MTVSTPADQSLRHRALRPVRAFGALMLVLSALIGSFALLVPAASSAAAPDTVGGSAYGAEISLAGTSVLPPTPLVTLPAAGTPAGAPVTDTTLPIPGEPLLLNATL